MPDPVIVPEPSRTPLPDPIPGAPEPAPLPQEPAPANPSPPDGPTPEPLGVPAPLPNGIPDPGSPDPGFEEQTEVPGDQPSELPSYTPGLGD